MESNVLQVNDNRTIQALTFLSTMNVRILQYLYNKQDDNYFCISADFIGELVHNFLLRPIDCRI